MGGRGHPARDAVLVSPGKTSPMKLISDLLLVSRFIREYICAV